MPRVLTQTDVADDTTAPEWSIAADGEDKRARASQLALGTQP